MTCFIEGPATSSSSILKLNGVISGDGGINVINSTTTPPTGGHFLTVVLAEGNTYQGGTTITNTATGTVSPVIQISPFNTSTDSGLGTGSLSIGPGTLDIANPFHTFTSTRSILLGAFQSILGLRLIILLFRVFNR